MFETHELFVDQDTQNEIRSYKYPYPRPGYTADVVVFNLANVLLIRRGKDPFKNSLALPGGFVNEGERSIDAATRELMEETGLSIPTQYLKPIGVYDRAGRDPRGWTVSVAYHARTMQYQVKGMDDAVEANWYPVAALDRLSLAFDHKQIINDAWNFEKGMI